MSILLHNTGDDQTGLPISSTDPISRVRNPIIHASLAVLLGMVDPKLSWNVYVVTGYLISLYPNIQEEGHIP